MSQKVVGRASLVALAVLLGLIALIGGLSWERMNAARSARLWITHSYDVLAVIRQLSTAVREAEDGQRGYLLSGSQAELAMHDAAIGRASILTGDLQRLTADNPAQQDRLHALVPEWQRQIQRLAQAIQVRNDRGLSAAATMADTPEGRAANQTISAALADMTAEEQGLLTGRLESLDARSALVRWLAIIGGIISIGALLGAWRMINLAWNRSTEAEARQAQLAGRLHTALESLSQGVAVFGPAHRLRHWNHCFEELLNLPSALLQEETPYEAFVAQTAQGGSALLESEEEIAANTAPAGEPVVYERWATPGQLLELRRTPTPEGGFVVTVSDLTKRAQAEALLRDSQKMQAIGQLTGGIAHDFNNLLTVVIGNLELARAKLNPQHPLITPLERALWAAQRGGTLTSQLLAFARKQPLAPVPIDLSAILPAMVPLLRRTLGEHIDVCF
ncbi:MAG TPA: CHASE3 domain-containing protein, partial [Rhodopila sp.]|nr:CHASE3 domain-containing protein [Rhodopila sp.]